MRCDDCLCSQLDGINHDDIDGNIDEEPTTVSRACQCQSGHDGLFSLIPVRALERAACRYEEGSLKHGVRQGWLAKRTTRECYDSVLSHLVKHVGGWDNEDHLAAAFCQLANWLDLDQRVTDGALEFGRDDCYQDNDEVVE